jgi:hypothetical protein
MTTATKFWTYAELENKVKTDLDLFEEDFISDEELMGYANEAVDKCEQLVHTLYQDYFLDFASFPIISGTDEYLLPPTIYAHKIRGLIFRNGTTTYKIKRMGDWKKFEKFDGSRTTGATDGYSYEYFLRNSIPGSPVILFSPIPTFQGDCRVWFLRQANRFETGTDVLDVPEANLFVLAYIKQKCAEKEAHGEMTAGLQTATANTDKEAQLLVDTLTAMIPDAENEIEADYSHYEEMT